MGANEDDEAAELCPAPADWLAGLLDPEQALAIAPIMTTTIASATRHPHPADCCFLDAM